jgi:hypothetical protein
MTDDKINEKEDLNSEDELFDFNKLRLSQNYSELAEVRKAIITVPVRKPNRQEFIRVRSGEEWRFETAVLELKEERETYLVESHLWSELLGDIIPKVLFTTINRQNVLSLWPIRLPGEDGRLDQWNRSALAAAKIAETHWIRLAANMSLGAYEVHKALGEHPEPEWPEISFDEILTVAFKDKFIRSIEHPIIQKLRGY